MQFLNVVGARPNFMKVAPFQRKLKSTGHTYSLVHTGQHYDENMSEKFFRDLGMERPDIELGVGSSSHATQTAKILKGIEPLIEDVSPDWVVVVGDVNSTLAAALAAAKMKPRIAHIEGGIRSGNREMPEEINRLVVDQLSDAIFCFDREAERNLRNEGITEDRIHLVGDIMIDSLHDALEKENGEIPVDGLRNPYAVLTLHRPSNVDAPESLDRAYRILSKVSKRLQVVFPIHPRPKKRLQEAGQWSRWNEAFRIIEPLGYQDFVSLMKNATVVLTDSGSIQQETTVLNVPCLTLREETERGITIRSGTNRLVGMDESAILSSLDDILTGDWKTADTIPLWDGNTADRIVKKLEEISE